MRLANKEQLMLYVKIGKTLVQKIDEEKWGANVVSKISNDLQQQLPGLRGFSRRNLLKMKQFYIEYKIHLNIPAHLKNPDREIIVPSLTAQFDAKILESFWSLSFSHHII